MRLKKILVKLKDEGVKLPGKLRDIQAEQLEISCTELARMEVIQKNLIPPFMDLLKKNTINASAAYELARLDAGDQTILLERYEEQGITPCAADVQTYREKNALDWLRTDCPGEALGYTDHQLRENGQPIECRNWQDIRDHKAKGHAELCPGCCYECEKETCKERCDQAKVKKRQELLEAEKHDMENTEPEAPQTQEGPEEDMDFASLPLSKFPQRLRRAMNIREISIKGLSKNLDEMMRKYSQVGFSSKYGVGDEDEICEMLEIEHIIDFDLSRASFTGFIFILAEALGVSIDWLLGRTETMEV